MPFNSFCNLVSFTVQGVLNGAPPQVLVSRELCRGLEEGNFHRGQATVTQFVARRQAGAMRPLQPDQAYSTPVRKFADVAEELQGPVRAEPGAEGARGVGPVLALGYRQAIDRVFAESAAAADAARLGGGCSADNPCAFAAAVSPIAKGTICENDGTGALMWRGAHAGSCRDRDRHS
jgi:hypothetical protein